jgi:hypothetical protein
MSTNWPFSDLKADRQRGLPRAVLHILSETHGDT